MEEVSSPGSLIIRSTPHDSDDVSYPGRYFGENQLLDGSISLSPLCPAPMNDLHVSTTVALHRAFARLRPSQAKFAIFRVPLAALSLESFCGASGSVGGVASPSAGALPPQLPTQPSPSLRVGVCRPATRVARRLLGPC